MSEQNTSGDGLTQPEREAHLAAGMDVGRQVATALIDVAIKHGARGVYKAVGELEGDQAKWGLALLVCFERDRINKISELSGYNPN